MVGLLLCPIRDRSVSFVSHLWQQCYLCNLCLYDRWQKHFTDMNDHMLSTHWWVISAQSHFNPGRFRLGHFGPNNFYPKVTDPFLITSKQNRIVCPVCVCIWLKKKENSCSGGRILDMNPMPEHTDVINDDDNDNDGNVKLLSCMIMIMMVMLNCCHALYFILSDETKILLTCREQLRYM